MADDQQQGYLDEQTLRGHGVPEEQINSWKSDQVATLQKHGVPDPEINKYFGVKETDTSAMRAYVQKNLDAFHEERKGADGSQPKEAASFGEAFDAGWENSVTGLIKAGHKPDTVLPEHAGFFSRLASNVGQLAGDIPAMAIGSVAGSMAGAMAGGAAGSVIPGVGTLGGIAAGARGGAGAGAFAAPAAMRKILMDHYEKGDVQDSGDFMARLSATTWEAIKGGTVGTATAVTGGLVTPVAGVTTGLAAELMTMTTAGAAMEGRLPQPQEFLDGAVMLGGFHLATGGLPTKLRNIYAETGERPQEIVEAAHNDPVLKQELLSENSDLPKQAAPPEAKQQSPFPRIIEGPDGFMGIIPKAEKLPEVQHTTSGGMDIALSAGGKEQPMESGVTGRTLNMTYPTVFAKDAEGNVIGHLSVKPETRPGGSLGNHEDNIHVAAFVNVDDAHQGKGVASALYQYANAYIAKMEPSQFKTEAGQKFAKNFDYAGLDEKSAKMIGAELPDELDRALSGEGKPPGGGEKPPEEPPTPPEPDKVAAARAAIRDQLATKKESGDAPWYSAEGRQRIKDKIYTSLVDRLDPLNMAVKDATAGEGGPKLDASENPYVLARNFPGWKGKMLSFLGGGKDTGPLSRFRGESTDGTIDFKTGKVNGEGLGKILGDIKPEDQAAFTDYSMAKRSLERTDSQFETGIKPEDAKTLVKADGGKFEAHFQRLVAYSDRVMTYAKDAGLISEESFNKIKKGSKDYIPFLREQDFDEFTGKTKGQDGGLYQEFEGSTRKILNPIEQIMRNTARVIKAADLNQVKMAFGDMVDANGFGIAEKIEKPTGADNEITFKRDGELQTYKTLPNVAEAIKSLNSDPGKTQLWARMLMAPAGWLRTGTVLNPDFIARHGERALFVSAVQSGEASRGLKGAFKAPVELAKAVYGNFAAIGDIMRNSNSWQEFLRSGGAQSSIFGLEDYLGKQNIWDLNKESGNFISQSWNYMKSPLEAMAHVSDNMARLAEFKRSGGVGGDLNARIEAGFRAREVTLDYMRAGAQVKALSSFVPFMNIGIQGIDRMVRGWKEDPIGFTARASAALTVPTLLNWAANRNDSRYKDAPNWEKDLYWIIPTNKWEPAANIQDAMARPDDLRRQAADGTWEVNNGSTLRISKPFELGLLFASVPERLLNRFADHDPRAATELLGTLLHGAIPNVLPTALTPLLEQGTNRNFFTGRPVVSSHTEGMLPEYQYNEYTSTVAKQLGKVIGYVPGLRDVGPKDAKLASPQVIDNYIHDWSGTLGQYALSLIEKTEQGLGIVDRHNPPSSTLADIPIIKAFIARHPSQNVQPIQDFYDDYEKASRVYATMKAHPEDAMSIQQANPGDMLRLGEIKKSLGALAKTIQGINEAPSIKANEKRQLIDGAYYQMSMIAKAGNQIIDQNRKQLNAQH